MSNRQLSHVRSASDRDAYPKRSQRRQSACQPFWISKLTGVSSTLVLRAIHLVTTSPVSAARGAVPRQSQTSQPSVPPPHKRNSSEEACRSRYQELRAS